MNPRLRGDDVVERLVGTGCPPYAPMEARHGPRLRGDDV
jgi:hypothetical protein